MTTRKLSASAKPVLPVPLRLGPVAALGLAFLVSGPGAVADDGLLHQLEQNPPPVLLGTTGGNVEDRTRLYCCSGTLGALVTDGTDAFILSNNHVLALTNLGLAGDPIIHPGLIDQDNGPDFDRVCTQDVTDAVASLFDFVPISFAKGTENTVDAAIALVVGNVSPEILDIGPVSATLKAASIGLKVMKSGRTTGFTLGEVSAVDVTVDVGYSKECGKGKQTARFVGQNGQDCALPNSRLRPWRWAAAGPRL